MTIKILVKTGPGTSRSRVHLYNPYPRKFWHYGEQFKPASVCYDTYTPDDGWDLRDGTLADVTCKKCQRWADGAHKREFLCIARFLGWKVAPTRVSHKKNESTGLTRRGKRDLAALHRWQNGEATPGGGDA